MVDHAVCRSQWHGRDDLHTFFKSIPCLSIPAFKGWVGLNRRRDCRRFGKHASTCHTGRNVRISQQQIFFCFCFFLSSPFLPGFHFHFLQRSFCEFRSRYQTTMPSSTNEGGFGCPIPHKTRDLVWIAVGVLIGSAVTYVFVGGCKKNDNQYK